LNSELLILLRALSCYGATINTPTDPYSILNVARTASTDDIRTAYRKLAKKYHPDLNPKNKEAERKFKELNNANDIISDPEKRKKFDSGEIDGTGNPQYTQPPHDEGAKNGPYYYQTQHGGGRYSSKMEGFDTSFFEELLRSQGGQHSTPPPADEHYLLEVDLRAAILGADQEMVLPTGKTVKVHIPPGIDSGKKLRLKGLAGSEGGTGDVYIEIRVRPSKIFTRNVKNLELELPITFYEAILGGEIVVPTLDKPVSVKVPAGSNTGTKLKLRGKGVAAQQESDRGDIILTLKVIMPASIDPALEEAVRSWSKAHPYNPREQLEKNGGAQ
jgi:DnaJ-class molecular chaperone